MEKAVTKIQRNTYQLTRDDMWNCLGWYFNHMNICLPDEWDFTLSENGEATIVAHYTLPEPPEAA